MRYASPFMQLTYYLVCWRGCAFVVALTYTVAVGSDDEEEFAVVVVVLDEDCDGIIIIYAPPTCQLRHSP